MLLFLPLSMLTTKKTNKKKFLNKLNRKKKNAAKWRCEVVLLKVVFQLKICSLIHQSADRGLVEPCVADIFQNSAKISHIRDILIHEGKKMG